MVMCINLWGYVPPQVWGTVEPNKQAATVLKYVNEILVDLRVAHGHEPDVTMI